MAEKVYQKAEIIGTSAKGYDAAIKSALVHARKAYKGLSWFEVVEQRGSLAGAKPVYQVTLKVGYLAPSK